MENSDCANIELTSITTIIMHKIYKEIIFKENQKTTCYIINSQMNIRHSNCAV